MEHTSSVRRPESGTWQSVAMETAAMGGRTGTHDTLWTWQQHEEAVQGAHDRLRAWQQHEESAIQQHLSQNGTHQQCKERRPESGTWQSLAMKSAAMGGRTGTHDTLWTWQQQ
ncbi:unnamed protein product, partial [Staurois parvus]